jgi:hypothetical protein
VSGGACGHDNLLIRATLVAVLDGQKWPGTGESGGMCWRRLVVRPLISQELEQLILLHGAVGECRARSPHAEQRGS